MRGHAPRSRCRGELRSYGRRSSRRTCRTAASTSKLMIEEMERVERVQERSGANEKRATEATMSRKSEELRTAAIFMPSHAPFQRQSMIATSTAPASRYGLNPRRPSAHNESTTVSHVMCENSSELWRAVWVFFVCWLTEALERGDGHGRGVSDLAERFRVVDIKLEPVQPRRLQRLGDSYIPLRHSTDIRIVACRRH